MALLTTQKISQAGIVPVLVAASAGGDTWEPASTTFLLVSNSGGSSQTVTVQTTASAFGQPIGDINVTVAADTQVLLGPYDPGEVANTATGLGTITYSSVTGITVAALSV